MPTLVVALHSTITLQANPLSTVTNLTKLSPLQTNQHFWQGHMTWGLWDAADKNTSVYLDLTKSVQWLRRLTLLFIFWKLWGLIFFPLKKIVSLLVHTCDPGGLHFFRWKHCEPPGPYSWPRTLTFFFRWKFLTLLAWSTLVAQEAHIFWWKKLWASWSTLVSLLVYAP